MKKIIYNILCVAVMSLLASCVDQQFEPIAIKEVKATICDFDYESENESRTSYSLGEYGYEAKWSDGDILGIYPVGGDQVAFPISEGTGASDAVFDGGAWALKSSYAYAAYYPFSAGNYTIAEDQIPVTYVGQIQSGNNTFTHFSSYDYLASKATHPDSDGNVSLKMKHMGSFFLLKFTMPKAGTYTKVTLTSDNQEFTTQGKLDLTKQEPSISPTSTAKSISINLKEVTLSKDNELLTVNMMVAPKDLSGSNITIKVTDNKGNTYTVADDQKIAGKEYVANKTYIFTRTLVETESPSTEQGHVTEPYFSETVELMGLVWRLAGSYEYNQCQIGTVTSSADKYFASMKNHQAVTLAKQYYQQGVCYDAVTGYANQLVFDEDGEIIFDPDYLPGSNSSFDDRWSSQQKNNMLKAVNDFYKESNFHDWFVSTQTEQEQAIASFKNVCNLDYTWFDSYYGKNDKVSSRIILSFMIGNSNNGISLKRKDGTLLLTPVLGSLSQSNGGVRFNGDMNLIVHEFSHPYCNPLIEENWSAISQKAEQVYSKVSSIMQNQAYSNAMTMMCETLVRSSAIRYMISHNQKNMVNMTLAYEEGNGFMMVRTLVNVLEKREQEASKYPMLADFMPELIEAINSFDPDDSSNQGGTAEPDTLAKDYVDLGIEMSDGKKLYFATRNVGETSPGGIESYFYCWGATVEGGPEWLPEYTYNGWPVGHTLDAAHDIATIKWGGDWHTPSIEEWKLLVEKCDYEKKEANESGYGVAGYFFYNKKDHSKFIFLPFKNWDNFWYWTSQVSEPYNGYMSARVFNHYNDMVDTFGTISIEHGILAVRPVIAAAEAFNANGHDYVDLGIQTNDGKNLYFATMNVGETSSAGTSSLYCWGATKDGGAAWIPDSYTGNNSGWPSGKTLDAAHDIATITWGEKWHVPSREEWNLLVEKCDYERKEASESGYGVAGYFFYNKKDRTKFIFLPVSTWSGELAYWTSEIYESTSAYTFKSTSNGEVGCLGWIAGIESTGFSIRPVFVE